MAANHGPQAISTTLADEQFGHLYCRILAVAAADVAVTEDVQLRVRDALLLRGSHDFDDLGSCRRFIDDIVDRINVHDGKRIEVEQALLQPLPFQRTCDYEETRVYVTITCGFVLRKVFYTVTADRPIACAYGCMTTGWSITRRSSS